ncbi:MAG: ABC transporter permease [Clostridia bacterium]|nr:ABC transporter permease [Clostridia bacterium]
MTAVLKREIGSYYKNITGWLLAAFLLVFAGIYCMAYNLSGYTARFETVLSAISFIYLIAVPIISMRALAEEKRQKTDQLLYSLPVRLSSVVIGKYLGMLVALALPVLILALYPVILSQFGAVQYASAYGALAAFFLLGACLLSIGLFISSVTESQVAAAVITLVVMLLLFFMSGLASFIPMEGSASLIALMALVVVFAVVLQLLAKNPLVSVLTAAAGCGALYLWYQSDPSFFSGLFANMMQAVSVFDRFDAFVGGVFDLTAIVYYLSIICVFLFLTVQSMEKRRWNE